MANICNPNYKKIINLFLFFCISLFIKAQPILLEENKSFMSSMTQQISPNDPVTKYNYTYTYKKDSKGNILSKSRISDGIIADENMYSYDNFDNEIVDINRRYMKYEKDCNPEDKGCWFYEYKYVCTYNLSKKLTSTIKYKYNQTYDKQAGRWKINQNKDSITADNAFYYTRDVNNNITENLLQFYDTAQKKLVDKSKSIYKFNADNKEIEELTMIFDSKLKKLVNETKSVSVYNDKKKRISQIQYFWKNNKWLEKNKWEWSFASNDSIEFRHYYEYVSKEWDNIKKPSDKLGWKKVMTNQFFYDAKNLDAGNVVIKLNPVNDSMQVIEQEQFQYDEFGNRIAIAEVKGEFDEKGKIVPNYARMVKIEYNYDGTEKTETIDAEYKNNYGIDGYKERIITTYKYDSSVKKGAYNKKLDKYDKK